MGGMGGFIPVHAHNGYLQCLVNLGIVGGVLMVAFIGQSLLRTYHQAISEHEAQYALGFIFMIGFITVNFTETMLMMPDHFAWVTFVYCSCSIRYKPHSNTASALSAILRLALPKV